MLSIMNITINRYKIEGRMKALIINRKTRIFFAFWILLLIMMSHCCYAVTGAYDRVPELLKDMVRIDALNDRKVAYKPFDIDKSDIPALIKELKNSNPVICAKAVRLLSSPSMKKKLGNMENDVITALRNNLGSDNHLVRQSAAVGLVYIDSSLGKEMMSFLIEAMEDGTYVYWSDALLIFRDMGLDAKDAVPVIIKSMKRHPKSRSLHYLVLVSIGTPEALEVSKGYIKKLESLKQYAGIRGELSTKPLPNIIIALVFICLFLWSRRLCRAGKQIIYLPLLIPMAAWSFIAVCAILYHNFYSLYYLLFHTVPAIDELPLFIMPFYIKYHTLAPGFLTLATLAGIIPWLLSLWRWRKKQES